MGLYFSNFPFRELILHGMEGHIPKGDEGRGIMELW